MAIRYYVYPYKAGSRSARALADALGGRVLKREGSTFHPNPNRKVINWGSSECPWQGLNNPQAVSTVANKLLFFQKVSQSEEGPRVPKWTTSREEALQWLNQPNGSGVFRCSKVVSRLVLTGHSGNGIVITDRETRDDLPGNAPLYVEYIPKDAEYRLHVFNGEVIDVQRKVRDPDREPTDWKVRSHANGFIYTRTRSDGTPYRDAIPVDFSQQAVRAVAVAGLDFGAVDLVYNAKRNESFVLEINSACGLEGATPSIYAASIRSLFEG